MTRIQISGALTALLLAAGAVTASVRCSPDAPFLLGRGFGAWITPPAPVFPATHVVQPDRTAAARFQQRFDAAEPFDAELRVRALGELEVSLDGVAIAVPAEPNACLKRVCRASLRIAPGARRIEARVRNPVGPPVLWLELEGGGVRLGSDETWRVASGDETPAEAVRADDTRRYPNAVAGPAALERARARALPLLACFAAAALAFTFLRRMHGGSGVARLPHVALGVVSLFWVALYFGKFAQVPLESGYDARFHVQYVRHLAGTGSLPAPLGGPAMYHPPLYHAATGAGVAAFAPATGGVAERQLMGLLPFLAGLSMVWIGFATARRLFDDDPRAVACAVLFTGLLPVSLYMSAYVSNEPLHAALASGALCVLVAMLRGGPPPARSVAALALLLGLACLTKYSALGPTALVLFFLGLKQVVVDRSSAGRVAATLGATLLGVAALSGWVYLRNWLATGDPLVWNLALPGGATWWQPPGFRTAGYYGAFGESLRHPFFSGFHSFWDGIYATLWAEGLPPTAYTLEERHGVWSYEWMAITCLLALPATGILVLGAGLALRDALHGDDLGRRTAWTVVLAWIALFGVGLVQVSIRYPVWGAVRSSYALAALVPLALVGARGFTALDRALAARGLTLVRAGVLGWSGALVGAVALSFAG